MFDNIELEGLNQALLTYVESIWQAIEKAAKDRDVSNAVGKIKMLEDANNLRTKVNFQKK